MKEKKDGLEKRNFRTRHENLSTCIYVYVASKTTRRVVNPLTVNYYR